MNNDDFDAPVEQATAAPGERRKPLFVSEMRCPRCGFELVVEHHRKSDDES